MKTQLQHFYCEQKKLGEADELFLSLVENGMTRAELQACINKHPSLWFRYEKWLKKLP
jgi:hypothetical protein